VNVPVSAAGTRLDKFLAEALGSREGLESRGFPGLAASFPPFVGFGAVSPFRGEFPDAFFAPDLPDFSFDWPPSPEGVLSEPWPGF